MEEVNVEQLAYELAIIVNSKARQISSECESGRDKFEILESTILGMVESSREYYNSIKEEGLKASVIEAEGYLKCALDMKIALENL